MSDCQITRDTIKSGIQDAAMQMATSGNLFERVSDATFRTVGDESVAHQNKINDIIDAFDDNLIQASDSPEEFDILPSEELIDAYEEKYQPEIREQEAALFEKKKYEGVPLATKRTLDKVNNFLNRVGVKVQSVFDIVVDGHKLNAKGVALPLQSLILHVTGTENTVLTEEAMHIGVELISQTQPELFKTMMDKINTYPIYKQTLSEYRGLKEYQKDGKPDINKIKKEAIGKLLTQVVVNQQEMAEPKSWWNRIKTYLKSLFSPLREEMTTFEQAVDAILQGDIGSIRETLLQSENYLAQQGFSEEQVNRVVNLAKSFISDDELSVAIRDIVPSIAYLQATPTVEIKSKQILDAQKDIVEAADGAITYKGNKVKETGISIAIKKLKSKMSSTNPLFPKIQKEIEENKNSEAHKIASEIISKYLDSDGFAQPAEVTNILSGKDENYTNIAISIFSKIDSFPEHTKFLHNINVADNNAVAHIDLLAIDPNETFHIFNFQSVNISEESRIERAESEALRANVETARNILSKGYGVSRFGQTRTQLLNEREEASESIYEATLHSTGAYDYLAPIVTKSETVGSQTLDAMYKEMYTLDKKNRNTKKLKSLEEVQKNKTLTSILSAFRALQISKTVEPLSKQVKQLTNILNELSDTYNRDIKGGKAAPNSRKATQFIKDVAAAMSIAHVLGQIQTGAAELNAVHPDAVNEYEMKTLALRTGDLKAATERLKFNANSLVDEIISSPRGVHQINSPELVAAYFSRNFRTSSMSTQSTIQVLHLLTAEAQHKVDLRQNDFIAKLKGIQTEYMSWIKGKGISTKNILAPITQKDEQGNYVHRLTDRISRSFYDKAKEALQNKDLDWVKANIDMKEYQRWYDEEKVLQFAHIDNTVVSYNEDAASSEALRDKYKEQWLDRYDLSRGLSEINNSIYNFPLEDKYISPEYRELMKKENAPALKLYNTILEMNQRSVELGVIDNFVAKTFLPFEYKAFMETLLNGEGIKANRLLKTTKEEDYVDYGEPTEDRAGQRRIPFHVINDIATRSFNPKTGETTIDYSNVSTDIFPLLAKYNAQIETYANYSEIEASVQLLQAVEESKKSLATDKLSGAAVKGGGLVENVLNKEMLDKFVLAEVYGHKYDDNDVNGSTAVNLNKVNEAINKKFGTNFRTDYKETAISVRNLVDKTRDFFIFKTLGYNPATAITNYLGTNMQAFIDSGQYFNKLEFIKNTNVMFKKTANRYSKAEVNLLGAVDLFIPLVDGEDNFQDARGLELNRLKRFDLSHSMMYMLRASDKPVQWSIASAYLNNTIIEGDHFVNIREHLRAQPKYVHMYDGTTEEIRTLQKEFEQEVKTLQERSLVKVGSFVDGRFQIPGFARDSEAVIKVRDTIQQLSKNATGMGTFNEYRLFNSTLLGRNLFTFFSWAPRLIEKRFAGLRYVGGSLQQFEQGRVRTFWNYLAKALTESGANFSNLINLSEGGVASLKNEFQKQVERYEARTGKQFYQRGENEAENRAVAERNFIEMYSRNVKAELRELTMIIGMMGLLTLMIKFGPDKDDKMAGVHKYAVKIMRRALGELTFYYNPMSISQLTSGRSFPGMIAVKDATKFFSALSNEVLGDEKAQEKAHPVGKFFKMVPVLSQVVPALAMFSEEEAKELDYQLPDPENPPSYNR